MPQCVIWELADGRVIQSFFNPLLDHDRAIKRVQGQLAEEYGIMIPHIADTDDLPPGAVESWRWSKITNRVEVTG